MTDVCFYFQVHQPYRLRPYSVFDIGKSKNYFDDARNGEIMRKVSEKCYLPMNKIILELIKTNKDKFNVAFSITGTAIEQFEKYAPQVLRSFKKLSATGNVEFLGETYYHSLSHLFDRNEFKDQVDMHHDTIQKHFGQSPKVFRNTELIYSNELAAHVKMMGYKGILCEGADHIMQNRTPNKRYTSPSQLPVILKNYKLSDDIAFRYSDKNWAGYPLTAQKFAGWVLEQQGDCVNLFMDYETFGEHQWKDSGILEFFKLLPGELQKRGIGFRTPSDLTQTPSKEIIDVHTPISWADLERDTSAWLGNGMQRSSIEALYHLKEDVFNSKDKTITEDWRKLTTSDHFYYMCTKWFSDGDVHKYFNPYDTPYDAYMAFMNVLQDMKLRLGVKST